MALKEVFPKKVVKLVDAISLATTSASRESLASMACTRIDNAVPLAATLYVMVVSVAVKYLIAYSLGVVGCEGVA